MPIIDNVKEVHNTCSSPFAFHPNPQLSLASSHTHIHFFQLPPSSHHLRGMNPSMFPGWTPLSVASGSQSPGAGPSSPVAPLGNGVATATTTNASRLPRKQRRWPQEVYDFLSGQ